MAYPNDGDPIRLRALDALIANLRAITTANGYHHDVRAVHLLQGEQVVTGSVMPVVIVAPETETEDLRLTCDQVQMELTLGIYCALRVVPGAQKLSLNELEWLISDVKRAIDQDYQLGGLVTVIEPTNVEVFDIADEAIAGARVSARMLYRHRVGDPATI